MYQALCQVLLFIFFNPHYALRQSLLLLWVRRLGLRKGKSPAEGHAAGRSRDAEMHFRSPPGDSQACVGLLVRDLGCAFAGSQKGGVTLAYSERKKLFADESSELSKLSLEESQS